VGDGWGMGLKREETDTDTRMDISWGCFSWSISQTSCHSKRSVLDSEFSSRKEIIKTER